MQPAAAVDTRPLARRAMMVPWLDTAAVGGISLVLLPLVVLFVARPCSFRRRSGAARVLFNWPHFIGSYRLLYAPARACAVPHRLDLRPGRTGGVRAVRHRGLAGPPRYANLLAVAAGVYLARHYTGQAWG